MGEAGGPGAGEDEGVGQVVARTELLTVGHGTLPADAFVELVGGAGIEVLVDVRRFPGSRRHPHFARDQMAQWLPDAGIAYRWEERLGGRRHGAPDSPNSGLRNTSFRAYADHMVSADFTDALGGVLELAAGARTAVLCAESLWWRCHRRLIADAAALVHDVEVAHLMHDGVPRAHGVTETATARGGVVIYPAGDPKLL